MYKEIEEKMRSFQSKNLDLESLLEQRKNELEKSKRNFENVSKEVNDLKEK